MVDTYTLVKDQLATRNYIHTKGVLSNEHLFHEIVSSAGGHKMVHTLRQGILQTHNTLHSTARKTHVKQDLGGILHANYRQLLTMKRNKV